MFNTVILQGRLTADPELKTTPAGTYVTSFTFANERGYGEKKDTGFFPVTAYAGLAQTICKLFSKGDMFLIEGYLKDRSWTTRDGEKRRSQEVVATKFEFCGPRKKEQQNYEAPEEHEDDRQVAYEDQDMPF